MENGAAISILFVGNMRGAPNCAQRRIGWLGEKLHRRAGLEIRGGHAFCYTDQDVGSAGATGNGEENIKVVGAHTIVEQMRQGATPKDAGMEALRRIARNYNNDMAKLRYLDMIYYIVRRGGAYAGVSLWSTRGTRARKKFVVHDGTLRTEPCDSLFEGTILSMHPF